MRVLVAGGAGFVGSHLCTRLVHDGHFVYCVDNLSTGRRENIEALLRSPRFSFVPRCVLEPLWLPVDVIFNLASPASPPHYQSEPEATLRTNVEGTRRLLQLAKETGSHFIYASSSEVYGDPLVHPQPENYWGNVNPIGPRGVYDEAKRYAEALTIWREYIDKLNGLRDRKGMAVIQIAHTDIKRFDSPEHEPYDRYVIKLHARASARFVRTAECFDAQIQVVRDGQSVAGNSIMGLMMLGAGPGSTILVQATGRQAREALEAITTLVNNGFDEDNEGAAAP